MGAQAYWLMASMLCTFHGDCVIMSGAKRTLVVAMAAIVAVPRTMAGWTTKVACETDAAKCKATFTALDAAGNRVSCLEEGDIALWPSMEACCPTMKPLGLCVLEKCSTGKGAQPTAGNTLNEVHHASLSGLMCQCKERCPGAVKIVQAMMKTGGAEAAIDMLLAMIAQKMKHPLMPDLCSAGGWACAQNKCKEAVAHPKVGLGAAALTGALANCPKTTTTAAGPNTASSATRSQHYSGIAMLVASSALAASTALGEPSHSR